MVSSTHKFLLELVLRERDVRVRSLRSFAFALGRGPERLLKHGVGRGDLHGSAGRTGWEVGELEGDLVRTASDPSVSRHLPSHDR